MLFRSLLPFLFLFTLVQSQSRWKTWAQQLRQRGASRTQSVPLQPAVRPRPVAHTPLNQPRSFARQPQTRPAPRQTWPRPAPRPAPRRPAPRPAPRRPAPRPRPRERNLPAPAPQPRPRPGNRRPRPRPRPRPQPVPHKPQPRPAPSRPQPRPTKPEIRPAPGPTRPRPQPGPRKPPRGSGGRGKAKGKAKKVDKTKLNKLKGTMNAAAQREKAEADARIRNPLPPKPKDPKAKKQVTEQTLNNPDDYWQGDVDLTEDQLNEIIGELQGKRKKRKVGASAWNLWNPFPISYSFAYNYPLAARAKIREGIHIWESNTCIRFQENGPNTNRIEFVNGGGCSSMVGMVGGTQEVSIATPGCDVVGIVCHEIGHALGFIHEQARPDRDQYVSVNYNNINSNRWNNFVKGTGTISYFNQPYDYGSVMHYDGYGFANNINYPTIQTLLSDYQNTIGQRRGPSFVDVAQGIIRRLRQHFKRHLSKFSSKKEVKAGFCSLHRDPALSAGPLCSEQKPAFTSFFDENLDR